MRLSRVKSEVAELKCVVDMWESVPSEEQMAVALAMVKEIYTEMRFSGEEDEVVEVEERVVVEEEVVEEIVEEVIEEVAEEVVATPEVEPQNEEELRRERRQRIISLYGETTPAEPEVSETPVVTEVPAEPKEPIASMLTINDRFLLSNDLFDGNMVQLNNALQELDNQPSLDDALLYIAQNYRWNGDSEGAKLLNTLLKKRF